MKLQQIEVGGVLRFTDPVRIDLTGIPPGLIAFVGANGEGKTTLLEAPIAAFYRKLPTRNEPGQALLNYALRSDSFIEATFLVDDVGYTARLALDGPHRKSEAVLTRHPVQGKTEILTDGKVTTFDAYVQKYFPSFDVLLASAFASQSRRGAFSTLDRKDRKALFAILLGLERYEQMAQAARNITSAIDDRRDLVRLERDVLARDTTPELRAAMDEDQERIVLAGLVAGKLEVEVREKIETFEATLLQLQADVTAHETAKATLAGLDVQITHAAQEQSQNGRDQQAAAGLRTSQVEQVRTNQASRLTAIEDRLKNNRAVLVDADEIRAAAKSAARLDAQIAKLQSLEFDRLSAVTAARAVLVKVTQADHNRQRIQGELERATKAAGVLGEVPCRSADAYKGCRFLTDAREQKAKLPDLNSRFDAVSAAAEDLTDTEEAVTSAEELVYDVSNDLEELRKERATLEGLVKRITPLDQAEGRLVDLEQQKTDLARDIKQRLEETQTQYQAQIAKLAELLAAVDVRIADLAQRTAAATKTVTQTTRAQEEATEKRGLLAAARTEVTEVAQTITRAAAETQELERRRATYARRERELEQLDHDLERHGAEHLDWNFFAKAFGREGLPVLEIDAAGPSVSSICNQLLEASFGARFSIQFLTQAVKKTKGQDGSQMKEAFTIQITDNERGGAPRDIADLSGGEQIIVDEALKNAIAIFVNSRSEMPIRTCWRDETTGPLNQENTERYLDMLRRVRELGGFHHILYVTHNAAAAAQADAQIQLADGHATIAMPPYQAVA